MPIGYAKCAGNKTKSIGKTALSEAYAAGRAVNFWSGIEELQ